MLISRDPSKISKNYTDSGVNVVQASYESGPPTLEAAFRGSSILFLISYPSHVRDYRVKVQLPAVDAARAAGVKHIFYSSLAYAGMGKESKAVVMQAHLETEAYLDNLAKQDSGFSYTAIREGLYSESFPIYTSFSPSSPPSDGLIRIPYSGTAPGIAWAKRDELGEATAKLIASYATDPGSFKWKNGTMLLSGSEVWTLNETVAALGRAFGRDVRIEEVDVEEYVKLPGNLEKFGEEGLARSWATAFEAVRAGECAVVSDVLQEVLGREPEDFKETIQGGVGFQDKA